MQAVGFSPNRIRVRQDAQLAPRQCCLRVRSSKRFTCRLQVLRNRKTLRTFLSVAGKRAVRAGDRIRSALPVKEILPKPIDEITLDSSKRYSRLMIAPVHARYLALYRSNGDSLHASSFVVWLRCLTDDMSKSHLVAFHALKALEVLDGVVAQLVGVVQRAAETLALAN